MCWSFEVSVGVCLFELLSICFIAYRAKRSKDPYVRAQMLMLPGMIGVLGVETCEAFLWLDKTLMRVDEPIEDYGVRPCSKYNQRFTFLLWMVLIPTQPLLGLYPLRRIGDPRNYTMLKIPEIMSIAYLAVHWLHYLIQYFAEHFDANYEHEPPRLNIQLSNYTSYGNSETCSYIGTHEHLFWSLNVEDGWLYPNSFTYTTVGFALVFARPWRFGGIYGIPMLILNFVQCHYFEYTVEVASVWCWSAFVGFAYAIFQPYLLPCTGYYNYQYDKVANGETSANHTNGTTKEIKSN